MKLQDLAVLFIIIIMPISLLLSEYMQTKIETLNLQSKYDTKLIDATYDALKAYQLNSFNSDTSDYTNSKIRDIEASANTFFNSMSSGFSELGYSKTTLQNYVPALVFTMNDGYYIYSNYTNNWGGSSVPTQNTKKFYDNQRLYGLRPYVYYSCRYLRSGKFDVTITYSLDNYIQIQGCVYINGQPRAISTYGYVLDNVEKISENKYSYRGVNIEIEKLSGTTFNTKEKVLYEDENGNAILSDELECLKLNGTKYYKEGNNIFSVIKGKKMIQNNYTGINIQQQVTDLSSDQNTNAVNYYKEAVELKNFIEQYFPDLNVSDAIDENGHYYNDNNYYNSNNPSPYSSLNGNIFDYDNSEKKDSNFNTHKREVIKHAIEKNLKVAITNYNVAETTEDSSSTSSILTNQSFSNYDYRMPKLKETDWDKILNNISIISFLQGINIGGKVYNGYTIVTNTQNEDLVTEDAIYIKNSDTFYNITDSKLNKNAQGSIIDDGIGILNTNTEIKNVDINSNTQYFIPVSGTLSYTSIVTHNGAEQLGNNTISEYVQSNLSNNLKKAYFTALGRERYGLYREKLEIKP